MDLCVLLAWDLKSYFSSRLAEFLDENWTISLLELSLLSAVPLALMKGSRSANEAAGLLLFSRFSRFRKDSAQSTWFGERGHAAVEEMSCSKFWLYWFFRFRDNDFADDDCELCAVCGASGTDREYNMLPSDSTGNKRKKLTRNRTFFYYLLCNDPPKSWLSPEEKLAACHPLCQFLPHSGLFLSEGMTWLIQAWNTTWQIKLHTHTERKNKCAQTRPYTLHRVKRWLFLARSAFFFQSGVNTDV